MIPAGKWSNPTRLPLGSPDCIPSRFGEPLVLYTRIWYNRQVSNLPIVREDAQDLWQAIEQAAPEVALALRMAPEDVAHSSVYEDNPGFKAWLLTEFALNSPTRLIRDRIQSIRDDQIEAGIDRPWPYFSKSHIDVARRNLSKEWRPVRAKIEGSIEQVGVIRKQTRLLTLATVAEELRERMYDERNEKTGQLYLQHDYLGVLRQIAEEMGDLGQPVGDTTGGLLEIAQTLAKLVNIQGSGIQERKITLEQYDEVGDAETPVDSQDADLSEDGLLA